MVAITAEDEAWAWIGVRVVASGNVETWGVREARRVGCVAEGLKEKASNTVLDDGWPERDVRVQSTMQ